MFLHELSAVVKCAGPFGLEFVKLFKRHVRCCLKPALVSPWKVDGKAVSGSTSPCVTLVRSDLGKTAIEHLPEPAGHPFRRSASTFSSDRWPFAQS